MKTNRTEQKVLDIVHLFGFVVFEKKADGTKKENRWNSAMEKMISENKLELIKDKSKRWPERYRKK